MSGFPGGRAREFLAGRRAQVVYPTREQVLAAYPQFPEFLRLKLLHDPQERFQSDWYRHYRSALQGR
jgi:hypothetical protein